MAGGQDIAFLDLGTNCPDIKIVDGDYQADNGIENAVLISLFSDRFIPRDELPSGFAETRGWWADAISESEDPRFGSRLWIHDRGKLDFETRNAMKNSTEQALEWMILEGIADKIEVETTLISGERIDISVDIFRPEGDNIPFRFLWDGQELKRG